jgi:hypothetical protein
VSAELVKNLHTIWSTMASGYQIDGEKFGQICKETHALYFDETKGANWYNIPPTLHKVLVHGQALVEKCPIPIGLTNEEASEANNKILRNIKMHHARRTSWTDGMSDLFHRMMDSSDPVILEHTNKSKNKKQKQKKPLSQDVLNLLKSPDGGEFDIESSDSDDSDV